MRGKLVKIEEDGAILLLTTSVV